MGMLRVCSSEGCETKTLGLYCIEHEVAVVAADLDKALHLVLVRQAYGEHRGEFSPDPPKA